MKIEKPWVFGDNQVITIGDKKYNVAAAIFESEKIEIKALPIADIYIGYGSPCGNSLRDFVAHMKLVNDADLNFPIILSQDGEVIDGKHRLAKALLTEQKTILTKRFIKDPQSIFEYV